MERREIPLDARCELADLLKMTKNVRKKYYKSVKDRYTGKGLEPPKPINPFISLGHGGDLIDSPLVEVRGSGNDFPRWYEIINTEMSRLDLEPTVKAKLWAEIVSWETMFVRAPPGFGYTKLAEYLPLATYRLNFPNARYDIFQLTDEAKNVIKSLLYYLKDSLDKRVTHSGVNKNTIYMNGVGGFGVKKPNGIKGENQDEGDYIKTELSIFADIIQEIVGEGVYLSDLDHLLGLLTVDSWRANWMFILNHPCFWSARKIEGVIGSLRNICRRDEIDNHYIRQAVRNVDFTDKEDWIGVWEELSDIGFKSCLRHGLKLARLEHESAHLDHSNMLFFLRNQFGHGHEHINHAYCINRRSSCHLLSAKRICGMVELYFPQFLSKFAFNVFSGQQFTEEMMNILFC